MPIWKYMLLADQTPGKHKKGITMGFHWTSMTYTPCPQGVWPLCCDPPYLQLYLLSFQYKPIFPSSTTSQSFYYHCFLFLVVGRASPDRHWWCQLPRWLWEETGKRPRHQSATTIASVWEEVILLLMVATNGDKGCHSDRKAPLYK